MSSLHNQDRIALRSGSNRPGAIRLLRLLAWALFATGLISISGCTAPPVAAVAPAVVVVANHTDHIWQVAFQPDAFGELADHTWQSVPSRESIRVELPAGEYRVWRRLAGDVAVDGQAAESIRMKLAADHTYNWPLVTLLSSEGGAP